MWDVPVPSIFWFIYQVKKCFTHSWLWICINHLYKNMTQLKEKSEDWLDKNKWSIFEEEKWVFGVSVCPVLDGLYRHVERHNYHNSIENVEGFLLIKMMVNDGSWKFFIATLFDNVIFCGAFWQVNAKWISMILFQVGVYWWL